MNVLKNRQTRFRQGTAVVEMSIVLLILMLLTLGAIEYGWMFLKQEQITNAARQAARLAATPDATNSTVSSEISTLMSGYSLGNSGYSTTFTPSNIATVSTGSTVAVNISVSYSRIGITNFRLLPLPSTLSASVTMIKEGP